MRGFRIAGLRKYSIVSMRDCSALNPMLTLILTLASCKNWIQNSVLTWRVSYMSTEPPQVVCLGTGYGSSVKPEERLAWELNHRRWFAWELVQV